MLRIRQPLLPPLVSISRPSSDVTVTGWSASTGSDLYAMIDEATASDTDYIISPTTSGTAASAIFGLSLSLEAGDYMINIRAKYTGTAGQIRGLLLDSSNNVVGTGDWQTLTSSYTDYKLTVVTTGTASRIKLEVL
jgi:hypothetical protein